MSEINESTTQSSGESWSLLLINALKNLNEEERAGLCFDLYSRSSETKTIDKKIKHLKLERKGDEAKNKNSEELHPDVTAILSEVKHLFNPKYITQTTEKELSILLKTYHKEDIVKAIKWGRGDSFWSSNFLSISKLNNKNRDKVKYIDVFLSKCKGVGIASDVKRPVDGLSQSEINEMLGNGRP